MLRDDKIFVISFYRSYYRSSLHFFFFFVGADCDRFLFKFERVSKRLVSQQRTEPCHKPSIVIDSHISIFSDVDPTTKVPSCLV